jgi:hypothetical protein
MFWDEPQAAWYMIPDVQSILDGLQLAYEAERGVSTESVKFAKQFDVETVWNWYWLPFLRERFGADAVN